MIQALKSSNEPEHLVHEAMRYLKGLKGNLVQLKKKKASDEHERREAVAAAASNGFHVQRFQMGGVSGTGGVNAVAGFRQPPGLNGQGHGGYGGWQ
jgi:hypothetical protein